LQDANTIIPINEVYRKKNNDPLYNIGKGSFGSPFSDIFRYKLLNKYGGWWSDMDITCLKPLQIDTPYFFRPHPILPVIGNLIKVPAKSELMLSTFNECLNSCNENTLDWLLPNKILNKHIDALQLKKYIQNNISELDWWQKVEPFINKNIQIPKSWYVIHWMNEEWRVKNINKHEFYENTTICNLMDLYSVPGVKAKKMTLLLKMKNLLKR
jgi:hypothetical protein